MRDAPNTAAGSTLVVEDAPPFVSEGRLVPAVIGVGFGVRAGLQGALGQDNVVMTVTHPPLIGNGLTKQSFGTSIGGELTPGITFYQFDYPYELVLGDWTMTAKSNGVTFYQTTFTVVPPETLPDLAAICGYTELLS
ncbi:DUF3859 domain-containing protein [Octadecabacter sp. CECT 8868]|uniref:DUF3859 domain-containing protein n=1 Tax=Octadecabacter algicola TaxID=2909342 RepID=UPI001F162D62|nr:DUF3859 domain-containing protein [Octadecabacter algicola]